MLWVVSWPFLENISLVITFMHMNRDCGTLGFVAKDENKVVFIVE